MRDDNGELKRSFKKWPLQFADITEPAEFGFKKKKAKGMPKGFYSVQGIIEMDANESHLAVRLRLLRPKESFKYRKDRCEYD